MSILLLILGLLLFVGLVIVHEWGHFIMARRGGVEVEEFGLGFPPKAKTLGHKNGTEYTLNWLPLGGFVRLKGEHDADTTKGSFGAAPTSTKIKIMAAGVVMNLAAAYVILLLLALIGMPKIIEKGSSPIITSDQFTVKSDEKRVTQKVYVGGIEKDSPADKAGLQSGDRLQSISPLGQPQNSVSSSDTVRADTQKFAGQKVAITYTRNGSTPVTTTAELRSQQEVADSRKSTDQSTWKGYLGISTSDYQVNRYSWSAPIVAGGVMGQVTELTFKGLGSALAGLFTGNTKQATEQVSGPVGIFVILQQGTRLGFQFILMVIALVSLSLAIMNVLPIPALDGGRLFVTLVYRAIKKPLTERAEDLIHGTGFALLMVLFVLITIVDVKRFF